uniref:uncharacterized protein LOC120956700 isoform X1 n=1 Tax=Anopheles coluzzii TaxID=1518534 RepID=UPI001AACBE84|nr:uncharacterized protein LOC120956700 isoform X1 [Anopheles coluzzii]XP_040234315.1 uncharacterized protein LOC120956700 isoform X1 [Anopheles coluzzii]XP_040234316.1 uncharacterized protein LOC120956700 isoform X1 [Anopheles coluzzii]XP_040234317.1 uncharacterized protein LOC120956700 isoform X1 [Anopheles coluzzii]XP_049464561.1 uncharacterized protein LOC120956700 isoform X1 [Anopheles coluzzii]XP_049464562.1 uncharacterized protein LOC120956700 isoform X1 [Anopheles coluzzii]XP_04946456
MKFLVLCTLVAGAAAGYSASTYRDGKATGLYNQVPAGVDYADKFPHGNTGYNGGYTTHFSGPNGAGVAVGTGTGSFAPGFAGFPGPTVDFNNFFQGIQANFANSMTQSYSEPGATASASSSLLDPAWRKPTYQQHNLYQQQFALQQALFQQQQAAFNGGFGGPGFGGAGFAGAGAGTGFGGFPVYGANFASAPNYIQNRFPAGNFNGASSSASFGPGGFHQTAAVYPGNPAVPNVDTRFGGSEQATSFQSGKPGFVGVSSFSSSSNINGQTHREAVTTVNDNGKVTTHRVHS